MDFSKIKVASAAVNHSKLDVGSTHITTGNFMEYMPVYYRHMLPGEHIKGVGSVLSRLAPVQVPCYGRCRINMRAFFVPFRTVFPNFNEFIVDTIASNNLHTGLVGSSPILPNPNLVTYFLTALDQITNQPLARALDPTDPVDAAAITNGAYDFKITSSYYVFSYYGRLYNKVLQSLGYRIIWDSKTDFNWSALGLLSAVKVYLDWYANSAYLNSSVYTYIQRLLKYNDPNGQLSLTVADLIQIFNMITMVCYDSGNDVYLNAWDNPMSPNNGLSSQLTFRDLNTEPTDVDAGFVTSQGMFDQPTMLQNDSSRTYLGTTYLHQALKSMTDYVKRNQLSGAYQIDRFLSRFGVNLDAAKVDRSIYIGASSVDVDFGTVMQTVNTAGANDPSNLGEYAGQGLGRSNENTSLNFDFKADEFGLFLVTYSIVPAAHLYQGFDRNNLHIDKMDFYQPEFDNLGCQVVSKGEVYVSNDTSYFGASTDYLNVWGYAPRFYEYKQKSDFVTGDFISPAAMNGGDAWHLNRKLVDETFSNSIANQTHGFVFTTGADAGTFDRIFQYTEHDIDKFYLVFNFSAESLAPCKSLFDTYEFDELGKQLTMDAGGAKTN